MFWLIYHKLLPTQTQEMFLPIKTHVEYKIKIKIVCHMAVFNCYFLILVAIFRISL